MLTDKEFEKKWYGQIVRPIDGKVEIPQCRYRVTAALIEGSQCYRNVFAVMSENYDPPINIDWFSFEFEDTSEIDEKFCIVNE